jgi:drug/metabolite transporter (DMT)-like permease
MFEARFTGWRILFSSHSGAAVVTGLLAGVAAGALWGLVFVAPRMAPGLSSIDLAAGRFVSFGLLSGFLMLLGCRNVRLPTLRQALFAVLMSGLGFTAYYILLVMAIRDLGTELPTLIIGTIPLWSCCWASRRACAGRLCCRVWP